MSQKGSTTLSLYPSSVTFYNSAAATANSSNNNSNNIMNHHSSSDDDDDDHDPSSKNGGGGGGGKSRRELPTGAVATLKAWLLAPEHFTHPYPTPQDQVMLMQKTGIDKKQLKNWFTNARRRIWKPMLKKQLEAGKLAAGVSLSMTAAAAASSSGGALGGGEVIVPELTGSFQQQQQQQQQHQHYSQQQQQQHPPPEPRQEMYSNFQQAQCQQHQGLDPSSSYEQQQQYQQQQQVQFLQDIGQVQQQPAYDQYGNQIYDASASYQQPYPYQQDTQSSININNNNNNNNTSMNSSDKTTNFPLSNSIGSLPPMTPGSSMGGGGASTSSFGNMVKTDSHAVLMELFARDQDLVRQAASKGGVAGLVVGGGGSIHVGVGQQQQQQGMTNNNTNGMVGSVLSSASSPPSNVRWATGSVGGGPGSVLQKQHSVTFEGVSSLSSWPHFSSVSSLNNLGGLQGVKSITNLSAADLSSQGNLNNMGNLAHVKSIENMGRFDSFAFLEVFFDDKSGLNSSTHSNNGLRGVKRERDEDDAVGLSLDGDDGTSTGQFNGGSSNPTSEDQGTDPASESGGQDQVPLSYEITDRYDGNEMDGGTLKRAYDDALAARGLIAVRRSCEKLTDLALPAKMQRTLSQEYIRQHNQGQHMGDFFSTNNSAYAPNSYRNNNSNNNNFSPHLVSSDGGGNEIMNTSSVEVPSSTTCTLCMLVNVDTQLRPCGHMFHGRCLKPSLQNAMGPPKCPICSTSMQSAILAVPTAANECGGGAAAMM